MHIRGTHDVPPDDQKNINAPLTSSTGRLFDAVASIIGLRQRVSYEGQAAMELEFLTTAAETEETYPVLISAPDIRLTPTEHYQSQTDENQSETGNPQPILMIDWFPIIEQVLDDLKRGIGSSIISVKFHNTLAEIIVGVAKRIGEQRIVLTGGCFQNKYLTERTVHRLEGEGFRPYWHQRIPPNDGGISLGQIAAAVRQKHKQPQTQETKYVLGNTR